MSWLFGSLRRYQRSWLLGDLVAGVTVWAVLVPDALAYASIARVQDVVRHASDNPRLGPVYAGPSKPPSTPRSRARTDATLPRVATTWAKSLSSPSRRL